MTSATICLPSTMHWTTAGPEAGVLPAGGLTLWPNSLQGFVRASGLVVFQRGRAGPAVTGAGFAMTTRTSLKLEELKVPRPVERVSALQRPLGPNLLKNCSPSST